ncbi:MAG: hypothetical protein IJU23_15040 [Proteobacteria bacterium]|nr:hypothetical protein [Pseudomonadota bacterium]
MALKTKRNKRSLVTLKRKEPSNKSKEINEFTRLVIDGKIDLAALIPKEDVSEQELSKYPSIEAISAEMTSKLNHDIQHDTEVMDEILTKYDDHPLSMRLQMTLLRDLAKSMSDEQKEELYNYVIDENNFSLEPDDELNDKIFDSIALGNAGRNKKCIKNLEACIRRIEAKKTPHTFHDRPVYSLESLIYENLCFPNREENSASDYYQPPASYSIAYSIYAEKMMNEGDMAEALDALDKSLSWNPVNASAMLAKANILAEFGDSIRALETLEMAYPNIINTEELTQFYLVHGMLLINDDTEEHDKLAVHLMRLAKYLVSEDVSSGMIAMAEDLAGIEVENISRDEFIAQLNAVGIPLGVSETSIKAIEKTIATYKANDDTDDRIEEFQRDLDTLKALPNAFTEI